MAIRSGYPIRVLPGVEPFREPLTIVTDKGDPAWTLRIRASSRHARRRCPACDRDQMVWTRLQPLSRDGREV